MGVLIFQIGQGFFYSGSVYVKSHVVKTEQIGHIRHKNLKYRSKVLLGHTF